MVTFDDDNNRGCIITGVVGGSSGGDIQEKSCRKRRMLQRPRLLFFLCAILYVGASLRLVTGQLYEGSSCRLKNGTLGICKIHRHCMWAMVGYRDRIFTIADMVRCGFTGRDELICCLDEMPDQSTTERNDEYIFHDNDVAVVTSTTARPTVPNRSNLRRRAEIECERFVREYSSLTFHILGGEGANLGDFPHMAALGYPGEDDVQWNCGGSLVSENYILTAAHCLTRAQPVVVRLGHVSLLDNSEGQDLEIAQVIMHPEYVASRNYHDIALLRLSRNVTMTENVYPACLRTTVADVPNESLIVTGWGDTSVERRQKSTHLLKTNLTAVDLPSCNQSYAEQQRMRRLPTLLNGGQLCASDPRGINDACQGDSGGPLQIVQSNNFGLIVGVTSFGMSCGSLVPSVYARVAFYLDWLESVIWPN